MANYTPWRFHAMAPLLDVMGTETNWMPGGQWTPESDETMCLRRTLAAGKPYLLLQNTDFDAFAPFVEEYMARCMFYGILPSMFSIDASTRNYWTEPTWYLLRPVWEAEQERVAPRLLLKSPARSEP